ncbi:MAG: hypothetical protein U9N44_02985 [Chloroflexota bacterium]|nr:hypothetical protein [Chloroflexota bacterium]
MKHKLPSEIKERVKDRLKYHCGFTPTDDDIERVDRMLRNDYIASHEQRIFSELEGEHLISELLRHRDRIGSLEFERIWTEKDIFRYLTLASMCFRAGIPAGTIVLCRTALEAGLREKLAESRAMQRGVEASKVPEEILNEMGKLAHKLLSELISDVDTEKVLDRKVIEDSFREVKFLKEPSHKILDKFIHGDIRWMVEFARNGRDIKVEGARGKVQKSKMVPDGSGGYEMVFESEEEYESPPVDKLQEYKMIHMIGSGEIAREVLKATYRVAEVLYYENV